MSKNEKEKVKKKELEKVIIDKINLRKIIISANECGLYEHNLNIYNNLDMFLDENKKILKDLNLELQELIEYSYQLEIVCNYEYELSILKLVRSNFIPDEKLKEEFKDHVDGERIEKTEARLKYAKKQLDKLR